LAADLATGNQPPFEQIKSAAAVDIDLPAYIAGTPDGVGRSGLRLIYEKHFGRSLLLRTTTQLAKILRGRVRI
jgi:hypothetical protein